jgi:hypothetical protein
MGGEYADHEQPEADLERVRANVVAIEAKPMPMKNTLIMPSRLHLSASQPAGRANRPKARNPGVAYLSRSA